MSQEKEIEVIEENAVSIEVGQEELLPISGDSAAYDASDFHMPTIKIGQGLTQEVADGDARPGDLILSGMGETEELLYVVPMATGKRHELRYPKNESDKDLRGQLIERSDFPEPDGHFSEDTDGKHTCDLQKGYEDDNEEWVPAQCKRIYSYIFYVPQWETIARFDFKNTGLWAGKKLNSILRGRSDIIIELSAEKAKNGNYFVPTVALAKLDEAGCRKILDLAAEAA